MDSQNPSSDVPVNDVPVSIIADVMRTPNLDTALNDETSPISSWDALLENLVPENIPSVDVSETVVQVGETRTSKNAEKSMTSLKESSISLKKNFG